MIISGKKLSKRVLYHIKKDIAELSEKNIVPKIAIITVGSETTWNTYVRQKKIKAAKLGIKTILYHLPRTTSEQILIDLLNDLNHLTDVHGIIVQRPLPTTIDKQRVINAIDPKKDIDGFRNDSLFEPPIWLAVEAMLKFTRSNLKNNSEAKKGSTFEGWLESKSIVVIGKGETGGGPVIKALNKQGATPVLVDSKTKKKGEILQKADIIISGVGKNVIEPNELKKGVVLIGIGIHRGEDGKLHGDYDEQEVKHIASYYTPTPGGVGPLNLVYLFKNLTQAAKESRTRK